MTKRSQQQVDHLIEEASALPPGDPDRQHLLAEIDELDDEHRRLWLEWRGSYESLRERLRDVAPPHDFADSLLEIPNTAAVVRRGRSRWVIGGLAMAAAITLLVIGAIALMMQSRHDPFHELAMLMIKDHDKHPTLVVTSSEPKVIEDELNRAGKLTVRVPSLGDDFDLIGGRLCKFDRAPLAYTRWEHPDATHSLYQLDRNDFALPDHFTMREVEVASSSRDRAGYRVLIWQEDGFVYGLVCPHPSIVRSPILPRG